MLSRLASALAFGGLLAAVVAVLGTRDLESYDHAFFSLNRGTSVETVNVLGHPVYTPAIGLGARLPLHASLGASPAALPAPYLPPPVTYWLALAFAIATAVVVVRRALEPLCGRVVSWLALGVMFWSVPMVNYTIYDDWLETAVTYCAFVASVFAPHALLALLRDEPSARARWIGGVSVAAAVWGLVAVSHPGYWPLLAGTFIVSAALSLCRTEYPFRARAAVAAVLAAAALLAVAPQAPDIARELDVAGAGLGAMRRFVEGPRGSLILANLFPWGQIGPRMPFTLLVLAVASAAIALASPRSHTRTLTIGSGVASIVLGLGAARLEPGSAPYAPSVTWALRDPALAFAVFSGACAAALVRTSGSSFRHVAPAAAIAVLLVAGLQGPAYAVRLTLRNMPQWDSHRPWTHDMTAPETRAARRGLAVEPVPRGERLAFWPGVRGRMRDTRRASTDFVDAGFRLVTAWPKQRTMWGLIRPNELLFNQSVELSPQVLCDSDAVRFLQLRYLILPPDVECEPWSVVPGMLVDDSFAVAAATRSDAMVRALPVASLSEPFRQAPALSTAPGLLSTVVPLAGTSVVIGTRTITIRLKDAEVAQGQALVLPAAHDTAWRASAGRVQNAGGLIALIDVDQADVTLEFVPDTVSVMRAGAMSVAQWLAIVGLVGLAAVCPVGRRRSRPVTSGALSTYTG